MKKIFLPLILILFPLSLLAQFMVIEEPSILKTPDGNIYGTLRVPDKEKVMPLALIIAGSGPTDRDGNNPQMKNNSLRMLAEGLFYNGIASLSFDKFGIGESKSEEKKEEDLTFDDFINDARLWIDLLSEDKRFSEIIIVGHSEGSLIGMIAGQDKPKVKKFVSIAGSGKPMNETLKEQLEAQLRLQPPGIKETVFSYIDKLERGEKIADVPASLNVLFRPSVQPFLISIFKYKPQLEISKLTIPVLILQGTMDIQVSEKQAELLSEANPKAKKVIIENMDHVLKDSDTTDMMSQVSSSYNNPISPINKELVKCISDFIKED